MGSVESGPGATLPGSVLREILAQLRRAGGALADFTLLADLTALRANCLFACSNGALAARYTRLPFPAIALYGDSPDLFASLVGELVEEDERFYVLVNETKRRLVERAFVVNHVDQEWQMEFVEDPSQLPAVDALALNRHDLPAMRKLAVAADLMALEADPFDVGPAYGIWRDHPYRRLVSMATTRLRIPGGAEIGNITTHPAFRRMGLARQSVAALVRALAQEGQRVFLMVFRSNDAAIALYEGLGFRRLRPMFLMECQVANA